jgi:hypothetical protein
VQPFEGVDLDSFWQESEYATQEYVDAPLTPGGLRAMLIKSSAAMPSALSAS